MSKKSTKNNNIKDIVKNINMFHKKLQDKNIDENFWIICDRADFKPLTKITFKKDNEVKTIMHSIKEIRDHLLNDNGLYYAGKKFANIKVIINNNILNKLNNIHYKGQINNSILNHKDFKPIAEKPIISVFINIFIIDDDGNININDAHTWGLKVNYYFDDFASIKFKLKNVEVLMRLVADSVVKSDLINDITYKQLASKLNKKK